MEAGSPFANSFRPVTMSSLITLAAIALAVALGIALAYVPLKLLLIAMARNVREFIQRQQERRARSRETPDRRHT